MNKTTTLISLIILIVIATIVFFLTKQQNLSGTLEISNTAVPVTENEASAPNALSPEGNAEALIPENLY